MNKEQAMPNLQIKNIDEELYAGIKRIAVQENRSVSQQVVFLIKECLSKRHDPNFKPPADTLLRLAGSWQDERPSEEIVAELKKDRKTSKKRLEF